MTETVSPYPDLAAEVPLLARRYIEARMVAPLYKAMAEAMGARAARDLVAETVVDIARRYGKQFREKTGDGSLAALAKVLAVWQQEEALTVELLKQDAHRLEFNVTRCRYAEMYAGCGLKSLGTALSCGRDFAFVEGFNPHIRLVRTQTLIEGAPFCDFRFSLE